MKSEEQVVDKLEAFYADKRTKVETKFMPETYGDHEHSRSRMRLERDPVTFQADVSVQGGTSTDMSAAAAPSKTTKEQTHVPIMSESATSKELNVGNLERATNANDGLADMDMVIAESRPMTSLTLAEETKRGENGYKQTATSFEPYASYGDSAGTRNQTAAQAHRNKLQKADFGVVQLIASKVGSRRSSVGAALSPGGYESGRVFDEAMNQILHDVEQEKNRKKNKSFVGVGAFINSRALSPAIALVGNKDPVGINKRDLRSPEF